MDKIKRKYIILIIAFILLFGISGTFAWFVFRSNNNAIVNTNAHYNTGGYLTYKAHA